MRKFAYLEHGYNSKLCHFRWWLAKKVLGKLALCYNMEIFIPKGLGTANIIKGHVEKNFHNKYVLVTKCLINFEKEE